MKNNKTINNFVINGLAITFLILCVYFISEGFRIGEWSYIWFVAQLMMATVLIQIAYLLINRLEIQLFLLQILVQYFTAVVIVFGMGYIFSWYNNNTFWIILINVTMVFAMTYLLGIIKMNNDIKEINSLLDSKKRVEIDVGNQYETDI